MKRLLAFTMIISVLLSGCQSKTISHTCKFSDDDSGAGYHTDTEVIISGDRKTDSIDTVTVNTVLDSSSGSLDEETKKLMDEFFSGFNNLAGVTSVTEEQNDSYSIKLVFDVANSKEALEYLFPDSLLGKTASEAVSEFENEGYTCK
ncbi:MAG: hypothetical protein EOM64_01950 [Erysipelotrichia bacterium]|nr:hypothetical protein [Erysipelotrichia bacterium]